MYVRTRMGAAAAAGLADDDKGQKPDAGSYQAPSISQKHTSIYAPRIWFRCTKRYMGELMSHHCYEQM